MSARIVNISLPALVSGTLAAPPATPPGPAPTDQVMYQRPFKLRSTYRFEACRQPFEITNGTILVLNAEPALYSPKDSAQGESWRLSVVKAPGQP